jgi:hypothetical protein
MAVGVAALLAVKESAQVERGVRTYNIADFDSTSFFGHTVGIWGRARWA